MSLNIADNFSYLGKKPLDSRLLYATLADMCSISDSTIYDGAIAYNQETGIFYYYDSNVVPNAITGRWRQLEATISGDAVTAQEYKEDTQYESNTLVFLGDKICRVESTYTSSNLGDIDASFDNDIKSKNLSLINTDHEAGSTSPYIQGNFYHKDKLVYNDDRMYRVLQNFVSDSSYTTIQESIDFDILDGNLLLVNKEREAILVPYEQGTFYGTGKVVYGDTRIAEVISDFISDSSAPTVAESMDIDISLGNLKEAAEKYRFKLYFTIGDIERVVNDITVISADDIVFENGETIDNMQIHDGVYSRLGTLAVIQEIDRNTNEITIKTVNSRKDLCMPPAPDRYQYTIVTPGSGFSIGDIVPTDMPDVNVEVDGIGSQGGITHVKKTYETITSSNGVGQEISASMQLYVGNGMDWYEMPAPQDSALIREYEPGDHYIEDTLIFFQDVLARATQDFTADAFAPSAQDSFSTDLTNGYMIRMTKEDVSVPECLGQVKSDKPEDLPTLAIKGNWVIVNDC